MWLVRKRKPASDSWELAGHSQLGLGVLLLDTNNFIEHQHQTKQLSWWWVKTKEIHFFVIKSEIRQKREHHPNRKGAKTGSQQMNAFVVTFGSKFLHTPWLLNESLKQHVARFSTKPGAQLTLKMFNWLNVCLRLDRAALLEPALAGCLGLHPGNMTPGSLVLREDGKELLLPVN